MNDTLNIEAIKGELEKKQHEIESWERDKKEKKAALDKAKTEIDRLMKLKSEAEKLEGEIHTLEANINHGKSEVERAKQEMGRLSRAR